MNICPVCGSSVVRETQSVTYTYRDQSFEVAQPGDYCPACGEAYLSPKDLKATQKSIADHKRHIDHLLSSDEIRSIRKSLNLTQEKAAQIFGGGVRAFHKYETGESTQSKPLDILLRLLMQHKITLHDIREIRGIVR
jgi:HTH-type transcriptional regulator/antitoxin MqsA